MQASRPIALRALRQLSLQRSCSGRSLWSAAACLAESTSAADFLARAQSQSAADPCWSLDFPALASLAAGAAEHDAVARLGSALVTAATTASSTNSPSNETAVTELTLTLSSPSSYATAVGLARRLGRGLRVLRLHADFDVAHARSGQREALSRAGEPEGGLMDAMEADHADSEIGFSSLANGVTAILRAVTAAKQQQPQRDESGTPVAPLEVLEVVNVDSSLQSFNVADDALLRALTSLIAMQDALTAAPAPHTDVEDAPGMGASPQLHTLTLRHLSCQPCSDTAVEELVRAITGTVGIVSLDLQGSSTLVPPLLRASRLRGLTRLRTLDLGGCPLGDVWVRVLLEELGHSIGGWHALETLRLPQCGITAYGTECMLKDVRAMPLECEIALKSLVLSANPLTDEAATPLATCLVRCHRLEELDLRHGELTGKSAAFLISALMHTSSLRVLRLRSNRMGNELASELSQYSRHWPALEVLDLTRCQLTGSHAVRSVASAVAALESLRELHLSGNNLRVDGDEYTTVKDPITECEEIGGLFVHDPTYVKGGEGGGRVPTSFELDRRDREGGRVRYRGPQAPAPVRLVEAFAALAEGLAGCRALTVLDLSDCCLSERNVTALATGAAPARLAELRLGANPILAEPASVAALVHLLWGCAACLRVLDLSLTGLGDWGLVTLCDGPVEEEEDGDDDKRAVLHSSNQSRGVLPEMTSLELLQLSHARVGPVGLEALTDVVSRLPTLRALMLDGNTAGDGSEDDGMERCVALLRGLGRSGDPKEGSWRRPALRLVSLGGGCLASAERQRVAASTEAARLSAAGVQVLV